MNTGATKSRRRLRLRPALSSCGRQRLHNLGGYSRNSTSHSSLVSWPFGPCNSRRCRFAGRSQGLASHPTQTGSERILHDRVGQAGEGDREPTGSPRIGASLGVSSRSGRCGASILTSARRVYRSCSCGRDWFGVGLVSNRHSQARVTRSTPSLRPAIIRHAIFFSCSSWASPLAQAQPGHGREAPLGGAIGS
jgi:hypothetical protein